MWRLSKQVARILLLLREKDENRVRRGLAGLAKCGERVTEV